MVCVSVVCVFICLCACVFPGDVACVWVWCIYVIYMCVCSFICVRVILLVVLW